MGVSWSESYTAVKNLSADGMAASEKDCQTIASTRKHFGNQEKALGRLKGRVSTREPFDFAQDLEPAERHALS
jgi:hypothetical protein